VPIKFAKHHTDTVENRSLLHTEGIERNCSLLSYNLGKAVRMFVDLNILEPVESLLRLIELELCRIIGII
jgi:hypothetical protein